DGELMLTILASYAQEESRSVSENCKWSIRKRFEKGIPISHAITGLMIKRGQIEVVRDEAEVVRYIFELRYQGLGRNAITRHLNRKGIPARNGGIWHDSVVDGILQKDSIFLRTYFYPSELSVQTTDKTPVYLDFLLSCTA
ncbi:MAG: recombinase family protein, partial [Clostridiales bacterium]|nr:recombinase family protein [Clostridiales bacterium]